MADWLDRRLGGFCKSIQDQIDDLPLLHPAQKEKFIQMLQECADKADASQEDSVAFMRRELHPLRQQVRFKTGKNIMIG